MGESTLPKLGELHVAYYNKGDNEFSILEGDNYAFKTVSPDPGPLRPEKHMRWRPTTLCGEGVLSGCNSGDRC